MGPEHDAELRRALVAVLRERGTIVADERWGGAGSQEVVTTRATFEGAPVVVESETYAGLSIAGNAAVSEKLAALVRQARAARS